MLISDTFKKAYIALPNFIATGNIGTAAATVDVCSAFTVNQTTVGITLFLPFPTNAVYSDIVHVANVGGVSFLFGGKTLLQGEYGVAMWIGTDWQYSVSATTPPLAADFWRSGAGAVDLPDGATDLTENIRRNGFVGLNVDPVSALDIDGVEINRNNGSFGNFSSVNFATALMDARSTFLFNQTTSGITGPIANPTNLTSGRRATFINSGTAGLGLNGTCIPPKSTVTFVFNGTNWIPENVHNLLTSFGNLVSGSFATNQVDSALGFVIAQTTAGVTFPLGNPTDVSPGRRITFANSGTVSYTIGTFTVQPSTFIDLIWSGTAWLKDSPTPTLNNYATNSAAVADATLLTGNLYTVTVGGFKQVFQK
jgi:hypothetical protein